MTLRAVAATAALAASVLLLTGCLAPAPDPSPTPTGVFGSEEEAFAAAEETYRAYVDAVNARREDPESQPDPQSFLIGEALEADIDSQREADRLGIRLEGESSVAFVEPVSAELALGDVVINACYDSTSARVLNESDVDVTIADRDPTVLAEVHLTTSGAGLVIEALLGVESDEC